MHIRHKIPFTLGCFCHSLQLIVVSLFKAEEIGLSKWKSSALTVAVFFRRHTIWHNTLLGLSDDTVTMKLGNFIRWWSFNKMFEGFLTNKDALAQLSMCGEWQQFIKTDDDARLVNSIIINPVFWQLTEGYYKLFSKLHKCTKKLESDKSHLGLVVPQFHRLRKVTLRLLQLGNMDVIGAVQRIFNKREKKFFSHELVRACFFFWPINQIGGMMKSTSGLLRIFKCKF
eukprot:TRINITY_DN2167_c0_g1_i2.p1 TRINITY_DN2167_c0_g1~~TRINITY_DN2167_c0_g1_i2.p1  ORF type:complete len:228 (-),score=45.03 TRINITY_DN2167_c0_g1_i2:943-1626(-)